MKSINNRQGGFTLIELMIVVAIIGILASVAVPAYQDYMVRSKMVSPLAVAAKDKTAIAEYAATKSAMPSTATAAGIATGAQGDYVTGVALTRNGSNVYVTYTITQGIAPTYTGPVQFSMHGLVGANGEVNWQCGPNAKGGTAIDAKYLPSSCRDAFTVP